MECFIKKNVNYDNVVIGDKVKVINVKANEYVRGYRANNIFIDWNSNYKIKIDDNGCVYINDNKYNVFDCLKPVENRGLYDLCIDNHIEIPESISKDSPCYKQFMKEKEVVE